MKKTMNFILTITIAVFALISVSFAGTTHSGQASQNAVQASGAASNSAAHSVAASTQVASAVIAVPLVVVGSVGSASAQIGEDLWKAATTPGAPLEISDETVTAGPSPDKAVQTQNL